ncbi:FAD-dependent oxidoreductase [Rhodococcus sp. USK10]|uniref:FAD-dependent oxidoreductase n=1 Tax=Rhodococcus sp. USK10 TaxID=2789739 RepID=UPI001C5E6DE0|nr:FAD-dependent oxidoreductase [Rhodococcus sp. USK10]QYB07076.1 FAD-dependent oxidoreductase [Rhodococcus sp. USK10]
MTDAMEFECDVVVIGAGMAGLTVASRLAKCGASVVVLEKSTEIGGTARGSGGYVWTLPDAQIMSRQAASGDPKLQHVIFEEFEALVDWMRALGTQVEGPHAVMSGRGYHVDIIGYLDRCHRAIVSNGGNILRNSRVQGLLTNAGGAVCGAVVVDDADEQVAIRASWIILATGGFTADPGLTEEFIGRRDVPMRVRASKNNVGDGLVLARSVGATTATSSGFYGHMVGTSIPLDDLETMRTYGLYHSDHALLLGRDGFRFVDESLGDHMSVQSDYFVTEGAAALVWDERINRDVVTKPWIQGSPGEDRFAIAREAGARTVKAANLDDLASGLDEWGFDGSRAAETVRKFNSDMESGGIPDPERRHHRSPLAEPPYYVIEVSPAITFPYGGLRVDEHSRVLDARGAPIGGLLAVGSDVGGIMGPDYTGGLCTAGSFAIRAARTVAAGS